MAIAESEIKKIALLARLEIDEQDIASYSQELSNLLQLLGKLPAIDDAAISAEGQKKAASIRELTARDFQKTDNKLEARLRPDEVTETDQREQLQKVAPATKDGYYLVPKVIE